MVVELRGSERERYARVGHQELRRVNGGQLPLNDERRRTPALRILGEVVTVVREPPDAEERVAWTHVVRTVGDPPYRRIRSAQRRRSDTAQ